MALGFPTLVFSQVPPTKTLIKAKASKAAADSMSEMPEVLVAPLFIESGGFTSRIVMVNELTFAITADVILFNRNGVAIASRSVAFPPHSQQALAVADLLRQANSTETVGSAEIHADPAKVFTMAIAAQLSITGSGISAGQHIEEEFVMVGTQGSGVLRSAGTALAGQPVIALKNTGTAAQTATVTCLAEKGGATQQQVPLAAGGSAFVQACSNSVNLAFSLVGDALAAPASSPVSRGAFGLSITGTGAPGTLTAFGFAWRGTSRGPMLSSQNFLDAGLAQSANVVFTGVPIGAATALPGAAFTPEVAVANFGVKAANATVLFARTDDSGSTATPVATAVVPAMSSKTIPLPALSGDSGLRNSFIVQSDAVPGAFYASIVSVGSSGFDLVEQIGKDQMSGENAGNHPWSLTDAGQDVLLLLFNHSTTAKYFNVRIGSGGVLWQQAWQLAPLETRVVSIRELIADQVKDENGATMAKTLNQGEISWFTPDPGEGKGRLLQIERAPQIVAGNIRVARNFSCGNYIILCAARLDISSITFPFGTDSSPLYLGAVVAGTCLTNDYASCSGQSNGWGGSGYTYLWTSNDTSIATVSGSSTVANATFFGAGVGTGSATGRISSHYCSGEGSGTPNVARLTCSQSVTRGTTATCSVAGVPASKIIGWSFTGTDGGTVPGPAQTTQWSGTMVQTGTVTVALTGGRQLSQIITVNSRSGWASATATASGGTVSCPFTSPPTNAGPLGCSAWAYSYNPIAGTLISSGPNSGYSYYSSNISLSQTYTWQLAPDVSNAQSDWAKHQAPAGCSGYLSLSQIQGNATWHESSSIPHSHYAQYLASFQTHNPGLYIESQTAPPGQALRDVAGVFSTIHSDAGNESALYTASYNQSTGAFMGSINYDPYCK